MKILQKGFNYSQDGPGNRLVYHLQGCNFKCKWCSNPESMSPDFDGAKDYTPEEIIGEIKRSRMMFFDGGGVTFTGGEPTMQYDDLLCVLKMCRESEIGTAIETNGSHPRLFEMSKYIDYMIMDIKCPDDEVHKKYTGHSNLETLKNFKRLTLSGRQLHLRIPLINHVNTNPEPFNKLFSSVNMQNVKLEILPYHEYGKCKWISEYEITDGFVSENTLKAFTEAMQSHGINLIKT